MTAQEKKVYEEIMGHVTKYFKGDRNKAVLWFRLPNPHFGDLAPITLVRMGRIEKVAHFVRNAVEANEAGERRAKT